MHLHPYCALLLADKRIREPKPEARRHQLTGLAPAPDVAVTGLPGVKVLGIPGSLRRSSVNRRLLEAARSMPASGVQLVIWDDLKAVPPFDEDDETDPPLPVLAMRAAIRGSGAVLVATPEYNSSLPGQLKNALDWASRPHGASVLDGKPVAVIGASPSRFGAVRAQAEARKVLAASGARVIDDELAVPGAREVFDGQGRLRDPELGDRLAQIVNDLATAAAQARAA